MYNTRVADKSLLKMTIENSFFDFQWQVQEVYTKVQTVFFFSFVYCAHAQVTSKIDSPMWMTQSGYTILLTETRIKLFIQ